MTAQTARGRNGVVSAGHGLAGEAAIGVLRAGGNAVDASIAAALVLAVVCPYAVSLAGDLYALVYEPNGGTVAGLNATGAAPAAATRERFANGIPGNGILSATVPGMLRGLDDLARRFGTRPLPVLLAPALRLAEDGFPVHRQLAANTRDRAELLAKHAAARSLFLPAGKPLEEHTLLRQPDLASVLRTIASGGVDSFYRGDIAREMVEAAQAAGGLFSAEDFAAHQSLWQEPIAAPFYGHDVLTMPPNSFGATLLWQLLALEAGRIDGVDPDSVDFILQGYEARRSAYRAVAKLIADPSQTEAKLRRALIEAVAGESPRDGQPAPAEARDRCTTCVTVIDRAGMAVSLIESVSAPYGAGVVLDGTGILLNNRMAGFNIDAESDNCVAPGKRPANTLAPCLVMKDGKLVMSVGTPGTVGQTCTLAQFLARVLACREDPTTATAKPRWSVDFQGKLVVEDTMAPALRAAVQARAPELRAMREGWISFGSIKLAASTPDGLLGIADHRRVAEALAW
ncbi:MAG TPA: gamma-glutamyltransferase [Stellaceae bacterium]|nr:gamma-glutamyltransferase [Stellaceae bacterium]